MTIQAKLALGENFRDFNTRTPYKIVECDCTPLNSNKKNLASISREVDQYFSKFSDNALYIKFYNLHLRREIEILCPPVNPLTTLL